MRGLRDCSGQPGQKCQSQDAGKRANDLVRMVQKLHGDVWSEKSFETLHMLAENPDGK